MNDRHGYQSSYLRHLTTLFLMGFVIFFLIFVVNQLRVSTYFPIKKVRVYGIDRLDRQEVKALVAPLVRANFFAVNVEAIRERLMHLPWVADVFVRRHWSDRIEITVVEKVPVAYWNRGALLSQAGQLFTPAQATYPIGLPTLIGPEGKQIVMLQYLIKMNRLLLPLHAKIAHLELTPFNDWRLVLSNGITLQVGHKDILTRLSQFVKVYPKVIGHRAAAVDYIDLRYPNGMAVRWRNVYSV